MTLDERYRIRRLGKDNIGIQRRVNTRSGEERWTTISYHGNSVFSLVRGLLNLTMRDYTPEGEKLSDSVLNVQLELVSAYDRLEEMVKEAIENDKL